MASKEGNAVIGQSGGPTAVINESLVGIVEGLRSSPVGRVLGMRHGVSGLARDEVVDLTDLPEDRLQRIAATPAAALGSSRDKPGEDYGRRILEACERHDVRWFFYIGGNDSSDTCRIVHETAKERGFPLRCFHVPKTVDNDLQGNDHTPGFPSAARFVATAFRADGLDNRSLPGIKINVVMGRHAGFLTAAAALARRTEDDGPHLVYVPEVPFDSERFVEDVDRVFSRLGRCQIAVSEGIVDAKGTPIGATLIGSGQIDDHGNVQLSGSGALGDALAERLKDRLSKRGGRSKAPRVRADTFGYLQRCWPDPSPVDRVEAREAGRFAAKLAAEGAEHGSVALVRESDEPYRCGFRRIELSEVAGKTRHLPDAFRAGSHDVGEAFLAYARPLVGPLPEVERI